MAQILIWTLIAAALIAAFVTRAAEKTRKAEHYFNHARHGEKVTNTGDAGIDEILPGDKFAVAAEFVFIYIFAQARLHRILMDIPKHGNQIFLAVYRLRPIPVLKQMSFSVVLGVVPVHKAAADPAKDLIEPFLFLFDQ
ncbi:MAG: hypothetical protein IKB95_02645, partial [Bacteroidales bacterium]|nr:hypothetical protein [Bacteroidales bacterium]